MKPRTDLVIENADGELIVLDKDGGEVHQLNQAAALVWNGLSEGLGSKEIAVKLTSVFEVGHERAIADVQNTIAQLTELGLLEDQN